RTQLPQHPVGAADPGRRAQRLRRPRQRLRRVHQVVAGDLRGRQQQAGVAVVKDPRDIILAPVVSEKSYALIESGVYTFKVHPSASKPEIRDAVQTIWGVQVLKVNTLNRKGKQRRTRGTNRVGSKPNVKHAIVTLAAGEIPLFES